MECNREEAIRAKDIAEKKMQNKDFVGAKKIALKAQQLFPDLDNISQMLSVCDVHCSASATVNGQMDWYGILQVEQMADDSSIKKQYRKLALLLHPDKNKFAGAESAFKLIGEAHLTLSDRAKRSVYDMKRRGNMTVTSSQPSQQYQPNGNSYSRKQPGVPGGFTPYPTTTMKQPGVPGGFPSYTTYTFGSTNQQQPSQAFWTICCACGVKYQYHRNLLNRAVRCQQCLKIFTASEINPQVVPPFGANSNPPGKNFQTSKQVPGQQSNYCHSTSGTGLNQNAMGPGKEHCSGSGINKAHGSGGSASKEKGDGVAGEEAGARAGVQLKKANPHEVNKKEQPMKSSAVNANRKRERKKVLESSDSASTDSDEDVDVVIKEGGGFHAGQNAGTSDSRYPRRSTRQKHNIIYNQDENEDDDDFASPKKVRKGESSGNRDCRKPLSGEAVGVPDEENSRKEDKSMNKHEMHEGEEVTGEKRTKDKVGACSNAYSAVDSSSSSNFGSFSSPDPEFYNFDMERDYRKFEVNQIWAVYDNIDAMPRYYVRIREVHGPDFWLRYTWLEHSATRDAEMVWINEELPVACGNYGLGKSDRTKNLEMFSHLMCWNKGTKRNTYDIYPRKGDIWAIFKGWDLGWTTDADNHKVYEYDLVEVLSDCADGSDIHVVHLVKIEGFVCLFTRASVEAITRIPRSELLRFSHKVPSYRLQGDEREGIPECAFELDTAALPSNLGEAFPSISIDNAGFKAVKFDGKCYNPHFKSAAGEEKLPTCSVNKDSSELNEEIAAEIKNSGSGGQLNPKVNAAEHRSSPAASPSPDVYEYPQTEFHDFEEDRSIEKLRRGQIWALYSDVDQYPKYYAKIKKVEDLEVKVSWVELCPQREAEVMWSEKGLPSSCGRFKVERQTITFDTTDTFSHLVHARSIGKKDQYDIYPSTGEVWALYKNWSVQWTRSELDKCEYDLVEVLDSSSSVIRVLFLTRVEEYNAVFMPEMKGEVEHVTEITKDESLRFSHQVPAFRLTDELGSKLKGYWELDPKSLPDV